MRSAPTCSRCGEKGHRRASCTAFLDVPAKLDPFAQPEPKVIYGVEGGTLSASPARPGERPDFAGNIFAAPDFVPAPAPRSDEEIATAVEEARALVRQLEALQLPRGEGIKLLGQLAPLYLRPYSSDDCERKALDLIEILVDVDGERRYADGW